MFSVSLADVYPGSSQAAAPVSARAALQPRAQNEALALTLSHREMFFLVAQASAVPTDMDADMPSLLLRPVYCRLRLFLSRGRLGPSVGVSARECSLVPSFFSHLICVLALGVGLSASAIPQRKDAQVSSPPPMSDARASILPCVSTRMMKGGSVFALGGSSARGVAMSLGCAGGLRDSIAAHTCGEEPSHACVKSILPSCETGRRPNTAPRALMGDRQSNSIGWRYKVTNRSPCLSTPACMLPIGGSASLSVVLAHARTTFRSSPRSLSSDAADSKKRAVPFVPRCGASALRPTLDA